VTDDLTEEFEQHRARLRAVAHRMLGSAAEADDAVQETWLRLASSGPGIQNLAGWLTTVVTRVCLNVLRAREARREEPADVVRLPDLVVSPDPDPEGEALLADSVGLALLVVLEMLTPGERLAFVLHDLFAVPFAEISPMLECSPEAARQLASRARRRVRGSVPDLSVASTSAARPVVSAFFAAARSGDLEGLIAVLHPEVVLRADGGAAAPRLTRVLRGARAVGESAVFFSRIGAGATHPVLVNGMPGVAVGSAGKPWSVMGFTVAAGRVVGIDVLVDPERLARLDPRLFGG
jgi:RNA polymerase sigma-70 factor, ECF subfamily